MGRRILILRPGALGDVIATRAPLARLRQHSPSREIVLCASGERGRLLARFRLADRALDTDRAGAAWFHSGGADPAPDWLEQAAGGADLAIAYLSDPDRSVRRALSVLGSERVVVHPARPGPDERVHIHTHLLAALPDGDSAGGAHLKEDARAASLAIPPEEVAATLRGHGLHAGDYAVLHPGSGSIAKNWPVERFAELGRKLASRLRLVVTAGEADGTRGPELARALGNATLVLSPPLQDLAALLAGGRLYVGNDSGVSHLASAVRTRGRGPSAVVLFGPTAPEVWGPPEAVIVRAPAAALARLDVETVAAACDRALAKSFGNTGPA